MSAKFSLELVKSKLRKIELKDYFVDTSSVDNLRKYLVFFMSLKEYLRMDSGEEIKKVVKLSSPPKEVYEYVGHNKIFKDRYNENFALMYE